MNMEIWNKVKQPPPSSLKKITGGRLSGMTDIKPQWRTQIMTEVFGPCGIGWKYEVKKLWTLPGSDGQVFAFADIELWYKNNNEWSDPIPGHGGSMLIVKEKSGLHNSDEGFKMAITDALSTAMKAIGVAADIYMGNWDGSKYINTPESPPPSKKQITLSKEDLSWLAAFCKEKKITTDTDKDAFKKHYGFDPYQTTTDQFKAIKTAILTDYKEPDHADS